jgi:hypothetical protein
LTRDEHLGLLPQSRLADGPLLVGPDGTYPIPQPGIVTDREY